MAKHDLDRLLRAAVTHRDEIPAEAPFGFATRVVALWRAGEKQSHEVRALTRFLRRIAIMALAVALVASAATYREITGSDDLDEPLSNDYAIADSAIQAEFFQ